MWFGSAAPAALLLASAAIGTALGIPSAGAASRLLRESDGLPAWGRAVATAAGAVLFPLVLWRFGGVPELVPYLLLTVACIVLALVDLREKRLPDALLLPTAVVLAAALAVCAGLRGSWALLLGALVGGVAMFVVYLVLAILPRAQLGFGDVKLSFVLGMASGYLGVRVWLVALLAAFLLNGLASLAVLALRRVTLQGFIPFGPAMIAGAFLAVAIG